MNLFDWIKITVSAMTATLAVSFTVNAAPIATIIDEVPVYSGMDSAGNAVNILDNGEQVEVLEIDGEWTLISNDKIQSVFVETKSLNFEQAEAVVNVEAVNVRIKPSTKGKILGCLLKGENVQVTAKVGDWYSITYKGEKAYIHSSCIEGEALEFLNEEEFVDDTSLGEEIANFALQFVGNRYVWGGTSLTSGADCSGFTQSVYKNFGYSLNRAASAQSNNGTKVDKSELQPGDLIFFSATPGSTYITHVVIYIGDGKFIHASTPEDGIRIDSLSLSYFANRFVAARRII